MSLGMSPGACILVLNPPPPFSGDTWRFAPLTPPRACKIPDRQLLLIKGEWGGTLAQRLYREGARCCPTLSHSLSSHCFLQSRLVSCRPWPCLVPPRPPPKSSERWEMVSPKLQRAFSQRALGQGRTPNVTSGRRRNRPASQGAGYRPAHPRPHDFENPA